MSYALGDEELQNVNNTPKIMKLSLQICLIQNKYEKIRFKSLSAC